MRMRTVDRLHVRRPKGVEEGLPVREIAVMVRSPISASFATAGKIQVPKARVLETARNGIEDQFDSGCLCRALRVLGGGDVAFTTVRLP